MFARSHEDERVITLKSQVADYDAHEHEHARFVGRAQKGRMGKRPVKRALDDDGYRLPTRKELEFAETLARRIGFGLPFDYADFTWFVRAFLNVFAYGRGRTATPRYEVKRRSSLAREFARDERDYHDLTLKCGLSEAEAEILLEYGKQRVRKRSVRAEGENLSDAIADDDIAQELTPREWFEVEEDEEEAVDPIDAFDHIATVVNAAGAADNAAPPTNTQH